MGQLARPGVRELVGEGTAPTVTRSRLGGRICVRLLLLARGESEFLRLALGTIRAASGCV
ncbi:MAG TPA: hypothetical protein VGH93_00660 [Solirubrobacteraceae bacterium]